MTTTKDNAGVWIDHRCARIVGLTANGVISTVILSQVEKHPERAGDSPMKGAYEAAQVPTQVLAAATLPMQATERTGMAARRRCRTFGLRLAITVSPSVR